MTNRSRGLGSLILVGLAAFASGCFSGFGYVADPASPPQIKTDTFVVTVKKIDTHYLTNWGVTVSVKNVSDHVAWFDPAQVFLTVPETGKKYVHNNKYVLPPTGKFGAEGMAFADVWGFTPRVWDHMNVASRNPIAPGATYAATIWFESTWGEADVDSVAVSYENQKLQLPD